MDDVTLLGVIAAGLGVYCLYLQHKWSKMMHFMQIMMAGIHNGDVRIEPMKIDGKTRFIPVPVNKLPKQ